MRTARWWFALLLLATLAQLGCKSAPVTGRKQLLLMPEGQETALGLTSFEEVTKKEKLSSNAKYVELVERVGKRIAAVADKPDYQWEFKCIESETQNAFCLPGGKVVVYEGIIPICSTEAGLAVVMSHEVAHALARHGGERMSQNMVVDSGKQALSYLTQKQDATRQAIIAQAYGLGTQYGVLLPYSREHETEADHIGLMLMAKAGYDPQEAPRFWTRFGQAKGSGSVMEFMSTHPSDDRRAADLAALVPDALKIYEAAPTKSGQGESIPIVVKPPTEVATAPEPAAGAPAQQLGSQQAAVPPMPALSPPFSPPLYSPSIAPQR